MTVSEISQIDFTKVWEKENLGLFLNPHIAALDVDGMLFLKAQFASGTAVYFNSYVYKSWGFRFVINPPGMAYCGFGMVNPPKDEAQLNILKSEAITALIAYLRNNYPSASFDLRFEPSEINPTAVSAVDTTDGKHTVLDITLPESELISNLSSRRKRNIKKQAKGYEVDLNPDIDKVMALLDHTFEKSDTTHLKPFYLKGLTCESPFLKAIIVSLEGQDLAANVVAYDSEVAYYFLGGIDPSINDSNAGTIAMWNAILEAKKAGVKSFNFCGSSIPSISEYFNSFGGAEKDIIWVHRGNMLVEKLKKLKRKF